MELPKEVDGISQVAPIAYLATPQALTHWPRMDFITSTHTDFITKQFDLVVGVFASIIVEELIDRRSHTPGECSSRSPGQTQSKASSEQRRRSVSADYPSCRWPELQQAPAWSASLPMERKERRRAASTDYHLGETRDGIPLVRQTPTCCGSLTCAAPCLAMGRAAASCASYVRANADGGSARNIPASQLWHGSVLLCFISLARL